MKDWNTVQSYPSFVLCEREGNLAKMAEEEMTDENSSQGQRQRLRLRLVSKCGMPLLKHLLCQLTYRRLMIYIGTIFSVFDPLGDTHAI